jgi:putative phosphoesterase
MRIALLSDIHGNLTALETVLATLEHERVDQIICLGDVAIFGPQPHETLTRVQALHCPVVMGNTDAWALDPQPHPLRDENTPKFNDIELWSAAQLTEVDRSFIRSFQPTLEIMLDEHIRLLCYHGSPQSFHESILATTTDDELARLFASVYAMILAGGHIHAQFVRRFQQSIVLNPGSVGLPYEVLSADGAARNPPWAEYAILTAEKGSLHVELRRTPVDVEEIRRVVWASGMPHAAWWLNDWISE